MLFKNIKEKKMDGFFEMEIFCTTIKVFVTFDKLKKGEKTETFQPL